VVVETTPVDQVVLVGVVVLLVMQAAQELLVKDTLVERGAEIAGLTVQAVVVEQARLETMV
jgi:hypothetical protein